MPSNADQDEYRQLTEAVPTLPIFMRPWWLDATCGPRGWDAAIVTSDGALHAAMAFRVRRRLGCRILSQPALTPFLGPWLRRSGGKPATEMGHQKDLLQALVARLPRYDHYAQNWSGEMTNWLPLFWLGFRQSTRYTYTLPDLSDLESIWKGMEQKIRSDVRKASGRFELVVDTDGSLEEFLQLNRSTFERQGRRVPYGDEYVRSIDAACAARSCRAVLVARDPSGRAYGGVYLVWDADCTYYLMGGSDPNLRSSGATSLCLWEAIRLAATRSRRFDFEGSMLEPIERFFRGFGAVQTPYFRVSHTRSMMLRIREGLAIALRGRS